ncbi:MAG: DctP family TRAP transporter solute-binding subunit [Firmicutes bacterium]|nr:DctP family TRAP transporter solute-binding subunit [Bacillota bacterium]
MKRTLTIFAVVFFLILTTGLVLADTYEGYDLSGLKPIKIMLSHPDVVDSTQHTHGSALVFKKFLEENSQGKITVNIQGGGVLGNTGELQEQVMLGTVPNHVSMGHTEGTISTIFPDIQVISIPYLFDNVDIALEVMEGEFGHRLFELMREKTGIKVIGIYDNSFRSFMNNEKPIHTPEDMKGMKIRVMPIKAHQEIVKQLGAIPTVVPWTELYTALQTGVVDGCENSPATLVLGSLHEVNKYLTLNKHVYSQVHIITNDDWYQSLPAAYQELIKDAGEVTALELRKRMRIGEEMALNMMQEDLKEIYTPTPEEIAMFRNKVREPVMEIIAEQLDNPQLINEILIEIEKVKKSFGLDEQ